MNTRSQEISAHEPCKYDPTRVVQCVYCKPAPPPTGLPPRGNYVWPPLTERERGVRK